jgi:hypothetical protein
MSESSYLVDVLALKLGEELLDALAVDLNTDGGEDGLNVRGAGAGLAAEREEEVSCEVLHFVCRMANREKKMSALLLLRSCENERFNVL